MDMHATATDVLNKYTMQVKRAKGCVAQRRQTLTNRIKALAQNRGRVAQLNKNNKAKSKKMRLQS